MFSVSEANRERSAGLRVAEAELLGLYAFHVDLGDFFNTGRELEIQTGVFGADILAEALHHPHFILFNRVNHR
jgi:hypothetical protein